MKLSDIVGARRLPSLDGLRAAAVLLVMAGHFSHRTAVGSLGVGIFFVLSGFLITWLLVRERHASGAISLRQFYVRRALRLFPALYVFLIVASLAYPLLGIDLPPLEWLASALYMNDYNSALHLRPSNALTHTWSLGIEEKFYLIWPVVLLTCGRWSAWAATVACAVTIMCASAWRLYLTQVLGIESHYIYFAFDTRLDYLAIGCLLGLHSSALLRSLTGRAFVPYLGVAAVGALAVTTGTVSTHRVYWLSFPLEYILIATLIVTTLAASTSSAFRFLNATPMILLGTLSYSAYLYHKLGWLLVTAWLPPSAAAAVLGGSLSFFLAALSYFVIERPFLRLKERYSPLTSLEQAAAPHA